MPALLSVPKNAHGRIPCILYGHQLTSNKEEVLAEFGDAYAARGVALMAIDARYHGERKGIGPIKAVSQLDTMYKMFQLTVIDMRRALDYLDSRGICDPARVAYEGRSVGGLMGSMLIGSDPRIKAAVLYVSGADWRIYLTKSFVFLGGNLSGAKLETAVRKLAPLDPKIWIARAAGRPVFMANGRKRRGHAARGRQGAARRGPPAEGDPDLQRRPRHRGAVPHAGLQSLGRVLQEVPGHSDRLNGTGLGQDRQTRRSNGGAQRGRSNGV